MINQRFCRLVVTAVHDNKCDVVCDCGTRKTVRRKELLRKSRALQSCGCLQREAAARTGREKNRTHGHKGSPTHRSWLSMRNRCLNPNNVAFAKYGGRGITVCERWSDFVNFLADMGERPPEHSIDRIDNNGNYEPGNCRWADGKTQARNRKSNVAVKTADGGKATLIEAAEKAGIPYVTAKARVGAGWTPEDAVTIPRDTSKVPNRYR